MGAFINRRSFLRQMAAIGAAGCAPLILPSSAWGDSAPSNRISLACIGVGRMCRGHLTEFLGQPDIQLTAVCDVDDTRAESARQLVDAYYARNARDGRYAGCRRYHDFRELVAQPDIDAVLICVPDHWHVLTAIAAAKAGKDIYCEKPLSYTIAEGRALSDAIKRYGRVFQTGSQQRSEANFRFACELVRNGFIGDLHTVNVGLEGDPGNDLRPAMPIPAGFDYDFWLGPAPYVPYTEDRCHPQVGFDRPGWLRTLDYSGGMMTGWGAHHNDIAQWGMGMEYSGPVSIEGRGVFPRDGLWDVHGDFHVEYAYANGVRLVCSSQGKRGVTFIGTKGEVFVDRGQLDTTPKSLMKTTIGPNMIRLYQSTNHKRNFIDCIKSRQETVAPVEIGHRSCSVCLLGNIAMTVGRPLRWNPTTEQFVDDPEANRLLSRPMRAPWQLV